MKESHNYTVIQQNKELSENHLREEVVELESHLLDAINQLVAKAAPKMNRIFFSSMIDTYRVI